VPISREAIKMPMVEKVRTAKRIICFEIKIVE
jgi:hypothetical protein